MTQVDNFTNYNGIEDLVLYSKFQEIQNQESREKTVYKRGLYTDSWNDKGRWIYLWKIPLFIKERKGDDTVIRLIGIPIIKLNRQGVVKKYCLFNIPIVTKERTDIVTEKDKADIARQLQRLKDMGEQHLESSV